MVRLAQLAVCGALAVTTLGASATWAGSGDAVKLFKIVTVRDEIVVGLTASQQKQLESSDAAAFAQALKVRGTAEVWRYSVAKGSGGELLNAPTARVGLLSHDTLRVEPYATPLPIVAPREGAGDEPGSGRGAR